MEEAIIYRPEAQSAIDTKELELPPNILTMKEGFQEVYKNKRYIVKDMYLPDPVTGKIVYTISHTTLFPGQQTRGHSHKSTVEVCKIEKGRGLMLLNRVSYDVKPNYFVLIPALVDHKIINYSETEEMIFMNWFPDRLIRPDVKIKGGALQRVG